MSVPKLSLTIKDHYIHFINKSKPKPKKKEFKPIKTSMFRLKRSNFDEQKDYFSRNLKLKSIELDEILYGKLYNVHNNLRYSLNGGINKLRTTLVKSSSSVNLVPIRRKKMSTINLGELKRDKDYQNFENDFIIKDSNTNEQKEINSLIFQNEKLKKKLKITKFKEEEKFCQFIIELFIKKRKNFKNLKKNREIFVVLDGNIVMNENEIKGFFMEIPSDKQLKLFDREKRDKIRDKLLMDLKNIFKTKKPFISLFSPQHELIEDILEIKNNYPFIYASQNIICKGISLVYTPAFIRLYHTDFECYFNDTQEKCKKVGKGCKKKYNFKIKRIVKGIKPEFEIYKPHYTFSNGEEELKSEKYYFYSDNDERESSKEEKNFKKCKLKNDFYLSLNDKDLKNKISKLKNHLQFEKSFDLRESYQKFICNFEEILEKYKKELIKKINIRKKKQYSSIDLQLKSYNLYHPKKKLSNFYIKETKAKSFKLPKLRNEIFYHNLDKNVNEYYYPFILYNIPKLLIEFKNFTRKKLFEIYIKYKDLISISYAKSKSDFTLSAGVDFDTFWKCMENLSGETQKFARRIFNQINASNLCVLSMKNYMKGMFYMQNNNISEKLEIFLKILDSSGKRNIPYNEVIDICKDAIKRSLGIFENFGDNDFALRELSVFFTNFVFKLVGSEIGKELNLDELKRVMINKDIDLLEYDYLEMFLGTR